MAPHEWTSTQSVNKKTVSWSLRRTTWREESVHYIWSTSRHLLLKWKHFHDTQSILQNETKLFWKISQLTFKRDKHRCWTVCKSSYKKNAQDWCTKMSFSFKLISEIDGVRVLICSTSPLLCRFDTLGILLLDFFNV